LKLLAVETASPDVSVALHDGTRVVGSLSLSIGSRHAEALLPGVEHLLMQCGWKLSELTHIAVDRGPGLFTGLRVGLSTVRALAFALDVPVVGVSSLETLAVAHALLGETVVAALDARRSEVYAAAYRCDFAGLTEVVAPFVAKPNAALATIEAAGLGDVVVVGDGALSADGVLGKLGVVRSTDRPSAASVASLAVSRVADGTALIDPFELLYLRAPDAEITWDNRNGPAPR
jgi:tRNA threonylcarbamoyl adenosine modification protein YeaZ